jgi:hypothetical protein
MHAMGLSGSMAAERSAVVILVALAADSDG